MRHRGSALGTKRRAWLLVAAVTAVIGLGLAAGTPRRDSSAEVWTVLVDTGDKLAAGRLTATLAGQPLTARKAYLLAFHQAQDAASDALRQELGP
jgi:hypothetical protein